MNEIRQVVDRLKASFKWVEPSGNPDELAMPYGEGCSGLVGYFRAGEFEDLKVIVAYVKQNIPQDEWRKGMNLIAEERKQVFSVRPNPLYVAMQEAEAVLKGYKKRQEMLKDQTDYSQYPEQIRPRVPRGLDVYSFEKIDGLMGLVSVLNDPSIKGMQFQFQYQIQKPARKKK